MVGPMLRHVVLLELEADIDPDCTSVLVDALRALPAQIDAIDAYAVHLDADLAEGNATVAVVGDFVDADAWQHYQDHPAHQQVIRDHVRPVLADRAAIQFEV